MAWQSPARDDVLFQEHLCLAPRWACATGCACSRACAPCSWGMCVYGGVPVVPCLSARTRTREGESGGATQIPCIARTRAISRVCVRAGGMMLLMASTNFLRPLQQAGTSRMHSLTRPSHAPVPVPTPSPAAAHLRPLPYAAALFSPPAAPFRPVEPGFRFPIVASRGACHPPTHARVSARQRTHARTHARTRARTHAHTHTRAHAHTRTHAHSHTHKRTHA